MSEEFIECWHCNMPVTLAERGDNDGFCPHCMCELDLDDYLCQSVATINQLRAELAAIKAQEPVAWPDDKLIELAFTNFGGKWNGDLWTIEDANLHPFVRSFAAPVSEAKAQGVVMPERWNVPRPMWKDARQPYGNPLNHADIEAAEKFNLALDEVARLNAATVQQASVPDAGKLADAFISWKLPASVRPDGCAMDTTYPHRYGTNLLTWVQAKEMFEYVLATMSGKEVNDANA